MQGGGEASLGKGQEAHSPALDSWSQRPRWGAGPLLLCLVPTGEPGQLLNTIGCESPNFAEGLTCPLSSPLRVSSTSAPRDWHSPFLPRSVKGRGLQGAPNSATCLPPERAWRGEASMGTWDGGCDPETCLLLQSVLGTTLFSGEYRESLTPGSLSAHELRRGTNSLPWGLGGKRVN